MSESLKEVFVIKGLRIFAELQGKYDTRNLTAQCISAPDPEYLSLPVHKRDLITRSS